MRLKNKVEELEIENKSLWRAITNYETHYRDLCDEMKKEIKQQGEAINDLVELFRPIIAERLSSSLGEINDLLEKELKDLFGKKDTPKVEKVKKPRAKKTDKVDEPKQETKTEKKSKKKGDK